MYPLHFAKERKVFVCIQLTALVLFHLMSRFEKCTDPVSALALSFWVRGCSSAEGQMVGSVGHRQLIGNLKAATKQLPILDILCGGAPHAHDCVTNRPIACMLQTPSSTYAAYSQYVMVKCPFMLYLSQFCDVSKILFRRMSLI